MSEATGVGRGGERHDRDSGDRGREDLAVWEEAADAVNALMEGRDPSLEGYLERLEKENHGIAVFSRMPDAKIRRSGHVFPLGHDLSDGCVVLFLRTKHIFILRPDADNQDPEEMGAYFHAFSPSRRVIILDEQDPMDDAETDLVGMVPYNPDTFRASWNPKHRTDIVAASKQAISLIPKFGPERAESVEESYRELVQGLGAAMLAGSQGETHEG